MRVLILGCGWITVPWVMALGLHVCTDTGLRMSGYPMWPIPPFHVVTPETRNLLVANEKRLYSIEVDFPRVRRDLQSLPAFGGEPKVSSASCFRKYFYRLRLHTHTHIRTIL